MTTLRWIRLGLVFFIVALAVSGLTAFPLERESLPNVRIANGHTASA
jgi:hypothetical protein